MGKMKPDKDNDEARLLASYEAEEWKSVKDESKKVHYRAYARATIRKDKRVNIRISSKGLISLQKYAMREGILYQVLISSVLRKYVSEMLVEK